MRKIIQITATSATKEYYATLYALCDDGSIWMQVIDNCPARWELLDTSTINKEINSK